MPVYNKQIMNFFKNRDLFGHEIGLNFRERGQTYNTCIGGLFSLILRLVMLVYTVDLCNKLIWCKRDEIMVAHYPFDTDLLGEIQWNDIGISSFYALKKGPGYSNVLEYDDEMQRHLNIEYV